MEQLTGGARVSRLVETPTEEVLPTAKPEQRRYKAIFFDRDGTLNVDKDYLYKKEEFEWMDGAVEAIRFANENGYKVIVITNQSGVARGYFKEADVKALHDWMNEQLKEYGAHIDAFYYCPHHPEAVIPEYRKKCECRKPGAKLVEDACRDFNIDKKASVMIGDADRDIECAEKAGVKGIKFHGGNLLELVKQILT
ncbi:MAG: HAD family hydrolase [Schwartzia succinivorans]|nr:HAD family hydrolase [Schwartzia succinivorans]